MPLQQINVSPVENISKESENYLHETQMYICSNVNQEPYGRSESQSSSQTSTSVEICRICHCEGDAEGGLIAPCFCAGSLRYVHQTCLQQWIKSSNIRCCELCKFQFIMHTKTKPFMEWEPLEMTGFERRKLLCAVIFHAIALTCVVWSLYVLINRTAEEINEGILEWPFWTKLIVVAIGFTGGVVFMYIQCKAYLQICQRWKAFNRVIYVQNAPEKQPILQQAPPTSSEGNSSGVHQQNRQPCQQSIENNSNSIDLKGVRNLHIFFKDESRVRVQNEDRECEESEGDQDTSWRIKIGKPESVPSQRCNETENKVLGDIGELDDYNVPSGSKSSDSNTSSMIPKSNSDSVLKLQIKKAEIVIKFGEACSSSGSEDNRPIGQGDRQERHKDTSVNIEIDKEREPIVIDVVKKKQPTIAESSKDPVKIRFDFGNEEDKCGCDTEHSDSKLLQVYNAESESDSGSHSPLLSKKHNSSYPDI